jgi:hypothetical protein
MDFAAIFLARAGIPGDGAISTKMVIENWQERQPG